MWNSDFQQNVRLFLRTSTTVPSVEFNAISDDPLKSCFPILKSKKVYILPTSVILKQ